MASRVTPRVSRPHFFITREEDGVHAEVFDSEGERIEVLMENGRKESLPSLRDENVNFFSRGHFLRLLRGRREEYIFNYAFNHGWFGCLRAVNTFTIPYYYPFIFLPCLRYDRSN